ncbi:TniB family NTP-binding protein [Kitasatospora sp. NPDC017646]|uniref:TniB family NTP-binding protein n=1 Tax=Kitasatospora sp. NPDC017646 TaxID=3364024 RepID=UPI00379F9C35
MRYFAHPGLSEPRTKEQWRAYVDAPLPTRPELPPYAVYKELPENDRELLDEQRHAYHSALVLVRTAQMQRLHAVIRRRMLANADQAAGARRGIVLDGPPTIGKSTLVKLFAADHERRLRRRHPEKFAVGYQVDGMLVDYTPVVYLNVPTQATPKDLSTLLAHYVAMPYRPGSTKTQITDAVLRVLEMVGTELVIIDDAHFLDLSAREGRVANEHLKYLANHTAATFVYTGADLKKSGLFLEGRVGNQATQTSGRNSLYQVKKFGTSDTDRTEWVATIKAFEDALSLYHHEPGLLARLAPYLYDRTDGSISALSDLIRESAIEAVLSGKEAITRTLMDRVEISHLAEAAYRAVTNTRTKKARQSRLTG